LGIERPDNAPQLLFKVAARALFVVERAIVDLAVRARRLELLDVPVARRELTLFRRRRLGGQRHQQNQRDQTVLHGNRPTGLNVRTGFARWPRSANHPNWKPETALPQM
jgi:hypothetical protein